MYGHSTLGMVKFDYGIMWLKYDTFAKKEYVIQIVKQSKSQTCKINGFE